MIGDGQEYEENPTIDEDGELIIYPPEEDDMEEFIESDVEDPGGSLEEEVADDFYEPDTEAEDDEDRLEAEFEQLNDEEIQDNKIGDIIEAQENYDDATDTLIALFTQALEIGEITADMSADIQEAQEKMLTAQDTITDLCGNPDDTATSSTVEDLTQSTTDPDLSALIEALTKGGTIPWLYIDDDGQLLLDGERVPKLKVIELEAQKIKADYGEFKDLTTKNFTAVNAKIDNLNVGDLDAINATITKLKATVAEIQTLIGGNLTMDNIHSLVLTSDKVTIANALIKDAMIDTVSANKINTGTINTNNVNIQSDDGSMLLQGNLQQFKDKAGNVRIQIGKDATGNFTFSLFDATGTGVLIDEKGIKSGAVANGLIVDAMVNDNANISGSKLDISSIISNINNNTNTIKASHIKFDDTEQTLDVSFNQLKKTVDTIKNITVDGDLSSVIEQVTTNTTNISVAQGQIASLISNTTITKQDGTVVQLKDEYNSTKDTVDKHTTTIGKLETNVNDVTSKQAKLEQSLDGFKMTVSATYATKEGLNEVKESIQNQDGYTIILSKECIVTTCD
jgi:hypothetical protein|nr:MAG TPA: hypothetical protein [Caudoviricetes sp.]